MNKIDELTQILYEISMSIGTSLRLADMLREFSLVTLRRLNGTALAIYEQRQHDDQSRFDLVFSTPRPFVQGPLKTALEQHIADTLDPKDVEGFTARLPLEKELDDSTCVHLMALPGYGLLALFRACGFLPPHVVHSLAAPNKKLAVACEACLSHGRLEERVKARTRELEAKNKELETFTYSVSHDLKAPLRGIDGYSRLLVENHADKLDEEGLVFLGNVRKSAEQMNELIEDLLIYCRMERQALQPTDLDVDQLVSRLLLQRELNIEQRGIDVEVNLPFSTLTADSETLRQVLTNFLDNAIKFAKPGESGRIRLGGSEDDESWTIWVQDNGIGIEPRFAERIFGMFQRLHRPEDYPGTGIGLAMVRKAAERVGGRVWVDSAVGEGATFHFSIPKPQSRWLEERNAHES